MQTEPTKAYAYQPGAPAFGEVLIYGVSGPGVNEEMHKERFATRKEAEDVADAINRGVNTPAMFRALANNPKTKQAINRVARR